MLYHEKFWARVDTLVKLPLLACVIYGSYQCYPFLFYMLGGASSAKAGWIAWLMCAGTIVSAYFLIDGWCLHVRHALPRIGARMLLLGLSVPLGVLVSILWPLVLIAAFGLRAVFAVMNMIK